MISWFEKIQTLNLLLNPFPLLFLSVERKLRLTQLTGRTHPSTAAHTCSIRLVTGSSVLAQTALLTVCAIKSSRAFWEKKTNLNPKTFFQPTAESASWLCYFTFLTVGPGPTRWAQTPPAGRVADTAISAGTALVTRLAIESSWACCHQTDNS